MLLEGAIRFVSQSGPGLGSSLNRAQDHAIGVPYMISTGNEVDPEISEFIDYVVDDPGTTVIATFIDQARISSRMNDV